MKPSFFFSTTLAIGLVAAASATAPAQTPDPSPQKLHTIIRLVSHPLCSVLRESVGPAIGQLIQNDHTIAQADQLYSDYLASSQGSTKRQFILAQTERIAADLAHRIAIMQKLLEASHLSTASPTSVEGQRIAALKKQLATAIADQQASVNIIYGTADTRQFATMMDSNDVVNNLVAGGAWGGTVPVSHGEPGIAQMRAPNNANPTGQLLGDLIQTQRTTIKHEQTLSHTVMAIAHECTAL